MKSKILGVYYEHPEWFEKFFSKLDEKGIDHIKMESRNTSFDPGESQISIGVDVMFNRMSPSAFNRGNENSIFYTLNYLKYLESLGIEIINGYDAYTYEFSKSNQINLLRSLNIKHPKTFVVNHESEILKTAKNLKFPIVLKPNIGGSGANIIKFETYIELKNYLSFNKIDWGIDKTLLVQEFLTAKDSSIIRVETIGGKYIYAIKIHLTEGEFNLCPADYCKIDDQKIDGMKDGVSDRGSIVEKFDPPKNIIRNVEKIFQSAKIDVGGLEYLVNSEDDETYIYDINAMSNFVADPDIVLGFDPNDNLVDFVNQKLQV
ncbi:MAG: hypothetical protein CL730_04990 [Chloroflexi bacterium]|nr:hypothetical protein [Chloroflexota bacterium]MBO99584.1 hypothetical protein [Chloroflexota bacterium]|tara:strand:+ start:1102 stop:2055 length:954 start_codon:yes stop_codon:yes gene_type:complete